MLALAISFRLVAQTLITYRKMNKQRINCRELLDPHPLLHLPVTLRTAYRQELERFGLLEAAIEGTLEKQIHGGPTPEETLKHFTHRFANSCSRVVCILVDPAGSFASLPVEIFQSFSSHKIAVLDAPCGAGASLLSLLCVLATARAHRQLPTLPLTVGVVGADVSQTALDIYSSIARSLTPELEKNGIHLEVTTQNWDATQLNQTSGVCDTWLARHADANEFFVLVGNLSGISEPAIVQSFQQSFEHITARISNVASTVLWIEPIVEKSITKRFKEIFTWSWWLKRSEDLPADAQCKFDWRHPIEEKNIFGNVMVHRYERKDGGNA